MNHRIKAIISMVLSIAVLLGTFAVDTTSVSAAASGAEYSMDLEGMINWMTDTKNLNDKQKYDLQRATTVINDAKEESFSKWYGGDKVHFSDDRNDKITDLSDINDAVNLRQLPIAIQNMKRINVLRHEDDNYANLGMKDSYTNFYLMSVATTGAMRGAGLKRHSSLKVSCECLSWGTTNGADNWYYSEKQRFNNIKDTLGITTITSRDQIKQIEDYADENSITIGHYTALFWSEEDVMGVGYTPYSKTACYNASKSSNYSAFKLYTVDEFEALVKEFCTYVGTHDPGTETITKAATCTTDGTASYTCNICGAKIQKAIPATGHLYGDWTVAKEAGCESKGIKEKVCSACGDKITEEIPATGHSWNTDYTTDVEPTCTSEGSRSIHCANCDEVKDVTSITATGHSFGEWTEVTASTCEDSGLRQRVCSSCGYTETESIDPNGHDFEEGFTIDVPATCNADGSQSRHCKNCDAVIDSEIIPAAGHSYGEWKITKNATCTETGIKTKLCNICGDKITETIPAKGHSWNSEPTVDKAATCTKDGSKSIHCARCSETKDAEIIPATGHRWNTEYTVDKAATQTAAGSKSIHCSVCDEIKEGSSVSIDKLPAPANDDSSTNTSAGGNDNGKASAKKGTTVQTVITDLPAVKISKPKAAKRSMTVKWKKVSKKNRKKIAGIQIQYSTDRTFKTGVKTVTAKKTAASKKIKKLASKKKYYVRVRAYKNAGGVKHVSKWSKIKTAKVK